MWFPTEVAYHARVSVPDVFLPSATRGAACLVAVVGALAIAGCGGSSGPSKSQYIAQADAICQAALARTAPLIKQVGAAAISLTPASARRLAPVVQRLHTVGASYLARLRALKQPSGDHDAIDAFLTPAGHVVDALGRAAVPLSSGQPPAALAILQQAAPEAQTATAAAQAYGFHQCGSILSFA
jgi:hypothetical protein